MTDIIACLTMARWVRLIHDLTRLASVDRPYWITGPSGAGKSLLGRALSYTLHTPCVNLDTFGYRDPAQKKWLIDLAKVPASRIYEGCANNLSASNTTGLPEVMKDAKIVYVFPSEDAYRNSQTAKLASGSWPSVQHRRPTPPRENWVQSRLKDVNRPKVSLGYILAEAEKLREREGATIAEIGLFDGFPLQGWMGYSDSVDLLHKDTASKMAVLVHGTKAALTISSTWWKERDFEYRIVYTNQGVNYGPHFGERLVPNMRTTPAALYAAIQFATHCDAVPKSPSWKEVIDSKNFRAWLSSIGLTT